MKNIHVLPTDKPSKLHLIEDTLIITSEYKNSVCDAEVNMYITSDEEIKDDDWVYCPVLKKPVFICLDSILMFKNLGYDSNGNSKYKKEWLKKIILTTDPDLIKDGVQAIDDEFLEWFVKNPSCEEVEIEYDKDIFPYGVETSNGYGWYKIIIPKEEPKQETLEEATENYVSNEPDATLKLISKYSFKDGTKWQAERMYSEEEVIEFGEMIAWNMVGKTITESFIRTVSKELFQQFKKK